MDEEDHGTGCRLDSERERAVSLVAPQRPHVDGQADEMILALVRLLARQAAREVFEQGVGESGRSVKEGQE